MSEIIYAIRRTDGEEIGEYSFVVVGGPHDWTWACARRLALALAIEIVEACRG